MKKQTTESPSQDLVAQLLDRILKKLKSQIWQSNYANAMQLHGIIRSRQIQHPNQLVRYGRKCFSQTDEDGITLELIKRIGIESGSFAEFGVGDGLENNTLILLALGWRGFWVGGEDIAFETDNLERLVFKKAWVTLDNLLALFEECCTRSHIKMVDLVSLDLDGNDYYFCEMLLSNRIRPKIFIVEYNAKMPPPVEFIIDYDSKHAWATDDYFGASLASFNSLLEQFDYKLVCCNAATGVNAFFVQSEFISKFPEVPQNIEEIYVEPHYFLFPQYGHKKSVRTIKKIVR